MVLNYLGLEIEINSPTNSTPTSPSGSGETEVNASSLDNTPLDKVVLVGDFLHSLLGSQQNTNYMGFDQYTDQDCARQEQGNRKGACCEDV